MLRTNSRPGAPAVIDAIVRSTAPFPASVHDTTPFAYAGALVVGISFVAMSMIVGTASNALRDAVTNFRPSAVVTHADTTCCVFDSSGIAALAGAGSLPVS